MADNKMTPEAIAAKEKELKKLEEQLKAKEKELNKNKTKQKALQKRLEEDTKTLLDEKNGKYEDKYIKGEVASIDYLVASLFSTPLKVVVRQYMYYLTKRAVAYKLSFIIFNCIVLAINLSIPVLSNHGLIKAELSGPLIAILSAVAALFNGLSLILMTKDNWVRNRETLENIKKELLLKMTGAKPYTDVTTADEVFAKEFVGIMDKDHERWVQALKAATEASTAEGAEGDTEDDAENDNGSGNEDKEN